MHKKNNPIRRSARQPKMAGMGGKPWVAPEIHFQTSSCKRRNQMFCLHLSASMNVPLLACCCPHSWPVKASKLLMLIKFTSSSRASCRPNQGKPHNPYQSSRISMVEALRFHFIRWILGQYKSMHSEPHRICDTPVAALQEQACNAVSFCVPRQAPEVVPQYHL